MDVVAHGLYPHASFVWQPRPLTYTLTVASKLTFVLVPGELRLAEVQDPLNEEDNYWDDDPSRSLYTPSDLVPTKPRVDVLLVGNAYAVRQESTRCIVVRLIVGQIDKAIEVFGDRAFGPGGAILEASRFVRMPLRYERASGGPGTSNPVGIRPGGPPDARGHIPIPNLQPVGFPLLGPGDVIPPIGFGPIAPSWLERSEKLGRFGSWSLGEYAQSPIPADIDHGYFNAAPRDQQVDGILDRERIILENLHPEHSRLVTALPGLRFRAEVERPGALTEDLEMIIDTLWIDTNRSICTVTWRVLVPIEHPQEPGRVVVKMEQASAVSQPPRHPSDESLRAMFPMNRQGPSSLAAAPQGDDVDVDLQDFGAIPVEMGEPEGLVESLPQVPLPPMRLPPRRQPSVPPDVMPSAPVPAAELRPLPPAAPPPLPPAAAPPLPPAAAPPLPPAAAPPLPPAAAPPLPPAAAPPLPPAAAPPLPPAAAPPLPPAAAPPLPPAAAPPPPAATPPVSPTAPPARSAPPPAPLPAVELRAEPGPALGKAQTIKLIGFDPGGLHAMRRHPYWKPALTELESPFREGATGGSAAAPEQRSAKDCQELFKALAAAEPLGGGVMRVLIAKAALEDGRFEPPVVVVAGELDFAFDEVDTLKALVTAISPFMSGDKKLKELFDTAIELLRAPWGDASAPIAEGLSGRLKEAFALGSRTLSLDGLDTHIERMLTERRSYQKRTLFGRRWIRAVLRASGKVPVYVPESLGNDLPMFRLVKVRMIAEGQWREDPYETSEVALKAIVLARMMG